MKEFQPSATSGECSRAKSSGMSGRGARRAAMREYMAAVGEEGSEGVEGAYGRRMVEMEAWYTVVESVGGVAVDG